MRGVREDGCGRRAGSVAFAVAFVFFAACSAWAVAPASDHAPPFQMTADIAVYLTHDPISIEGDGGFVPENGVVGGSGTEADPYMISGWRIDMSGEPYPKSAVKVANTTAVFVVSDMFIYGEDPYARGIYLLNVTSGAIDTCRVEDLYTGIGVQSSSEVDVAHNTLTLTGCVVSGSNNVTVEENDCFGVNVDVSSSQNVSVVRNQVNATLSSGDRSRITVTIRNCDRCRVWDNTLWTASDTGSWESNLRLDESMNCTVYGNVMNEAGVSISGGIAHYSTMELAPNNTVRMLPIVFHKNLDEVLVEQAGFGQLIIANCTDVRLQDLSISGIECPVSIAFCSDVDVGDCTFTDMGTSLRVTSSSNVRVRHNTFVNESEVWLNGCEDLDFSDNDLTSGGYAALYAGSLRNSTIEDNRFAVESAETYLYGSLNVTVRNNVFSRGGLRLEGHTASEYDSHTIDTSNLVVVKPILYLKRVADGEVDLSNHSQVILANCTGMDLHGMTTSAYWAIQMGFSEDIVVHGCRVYGFHPIDLHYADSITFYENDFVNPMALMHLTMTHNVTTYHCNIMGDWGAWSSGGFDGYEPTNILWDNGYPDGGNYWEGNYWDDDNYSGPSQDIPGADGICDRAMEVAWGIDHYPLVAPYVHDQWVDPEDAWQDAALWLSAIAAIALSSAGISYLLFVREPPAKKPPEAGGAGEP